MECEIEDSDRQEASTSYSNNEGNQSCTVNDDEDDDEVVKAIKAEKNKPRDHPPTISSDDFIVDISFSPIKNLLTLANVVGDVLFYEYNNEETKLVNTLELHLKACRDVEFDNSGLTLYSTGKVSMVIEIYNF